MKRQPPGRDEGEGASVAGFLTTHSTNSIPAAPGAARHFRFRIPRPLAFLVLIPTLLVARAQTPELRGWWADTFHAAMRTPAEVDALVTQARAAGFNAVFVEVRKRGDAYYTSRFEPKATDVQAGFDHLAYLITRGHDTNAGPRLEVHAWIVTYNLWNNQFSPPPQATHPYRQHPDWLTESYEGDLWDGSNYALDPGHPGAQQHLFNVAMDLVAGYDLDGLHLDYVRYAGREWGYNPVAIGRFNAATGSSGRAEPDDSAWLQWRRDQITGLVRRVYLAVAAQKPRVKLSAATITWTPTATTFSSWLRSAAWADVLQDWRGWMEEGILDLNVPMAYFRQETHAVAWAEWSRFAKANRFDRHLAMGVAGYLNSISNGIVQMRNTRVTLGTGIPRADGLLVYSYALPVKDGSRGDFTAAVTTPTSHDPIEPPVFALPVDPPVMPWKTNGTLTGLGGVVTDAVTGRPLEGAQVEWCDRDGGFLTTDANGAYGRLLDGFTPASLVVSAAGYLTQFRSQPGPATGVVAEDVALAPDTSNLRALDLRVTPGRQSVVVSWRTTVPGWGRVIYGPGSTCGAASREAGDDRVDTRHSVLLDDLAAGETGQPTAHWLRVVNEAAGQGSNVSHAVHVVPAVSPAQADEWQVRLTGDWTFNQTANSRPPPGWWRTPVTTGTPTATATWSVPIEVSGAYDVQYVLLPGTGAFAATYQVRTPRTNLTVKVSHPGAGSLTGPLATNLRLQRGDRAEVRLSNQVSAGSSPIAACRMRWVYRDGQDPPPANTLPDWWAEHFFPGPVDPLADSDADGWSNQAEFVCGTDPTHVDSRLRFHLEPAPEGGWLAIFTPRTPGRTYRLERTSDLGAAAWESASGAEPIPGPSGGWALRDASPDVAERFYRLRVSAW